MLNSLATNRKLAARLVFAQTLAAMVTSCVCLLWGWHHAMAALAGGLLVIIGTVLMAARGLAYGNASLVLARMLFGMLLRWIVILGGLFVVLVSWKWPPAPLLAGLAAALLAPLFLRINR